VPGKILPMPNPPISHAQAVADRESAARKSFWLAMLMTAGGVAFAAGVGFAAADVTAEPAWIALIVGGACAIAGGVGARTVMKRVRYRIAAEWAGLWLLLISAGVVGVIWAAGTMHLLPERFVGRMILPIAVAAVVFYLSTSTLFTGDCYGLRFRRTLVGWQHISQVVFTAGSKPGTFEIGARVQAGAPQSSLPVKAGQVLTDLPFRTVVSQNRFDITRLCWVLDQSGRQDLKLVERTADGERERARVGELR
jgi:hypothetical protein